MVSLCSYGDVEIAEVEFSKGFVSVSSSALLFADADASATSSFALVSLIVELNVDVHQV